MPSTVSRRLEQIEVVSPARFILLTGAMGAVVAAFARVPSTAILTPIWLALIRSPFWFVEALALIAVGRHLLRIDTLVASPRSI